MITSLIEMQELRSFGHMTTSTIPFESHNKTLLMTPWIKIEHHHLYFKMFRVEKECSGWKEIEKLISRGGCVKRLLGTQK